MSELKRLLIQDNGKTVEIFVESPSLPTLSDTTSATRPSAKGTTDEILLKMADIQSQIQSYAKFAIGAFQHLGTAEVEEITLKFGIKLGGKTGVIFTEGSAEGSMEISVKCKFPTTKDQ
jgi:hypothetical protein